MLTSHSNRLFFSIGLAAVLSLSVTRAAHASIISSNDDKPCGIGLGQKPCFKLAVDSPTYVAGDRSGDGDVTFTVFNPNDFSVRISSSVFGWNCLIDCSDNKGGDYVTNIQVDEGMTCGKGSFIQPKKACEVEIGFSLRDDQDRPDPDVDYGVWIIDLTVNATKGKAKDIVGSGYGEATIIALDKGATAPEPSSLFLMVAGVLALLLSRVIGVVRSLWDKSTVLGERRVS